MNRVYYISNGIFMYYTLQLQLYLLISFYRKGNKPQVMCGGFVWIMYESHKRIEKRKHTHKTR